jgi:hypothetical protein
MKKLLYGLMDLRKLAEMYEEQPIVSVPADVAALELIRVIIDSTNSANYKMDCQGSEYWMVSLQDLVFDTGMNESLEERKAGAILRSLGLALHRRNDGTKVAWSKRQLEILQSIFKEA